MGVQRLKQKQITFGYCDTVSGQRVYPAPQGVQIEDTSADALLPELPTGLDASNMRLQLTSWPPLGQATTIKSNDDFVQFVVLLESQRQDTKSDSEPKIVVWHDAKGEAEWTELLLSRTSEYNGVLLLRHSRQGDTNQHYYTGRLARPPASQKSVRFTIKFSSGPEQSWKWIKDATGVPDGELLYQPHDLKAAVDADMSQWFSGISTDISVTSEHPETPNTTLYSLTCPICAAEGLDSGWQHHQLGNPQALIQWFGLVRLWSPWLAPRQGNERLHLDKDGILLSFLRSDGLHVVCLAISGVDDVVTTFINDANNNVIIKGRNDRTDAGTSRILVAVADSFEVANAAVMYHARKVVRSYANPNVDLETKTLIDGHVKPEWLQEWYDGLTYCTWNGLGQKLTSQKIFDALESLSKENINITNLIIDDNWQSLSTADSQFHRGWSDFEANKEGFPEGLKATTSEIRKRHPNVNHIAVWHAILGYWGGIDPDGSIAKKYKTVEVEKEPGVTEGKFTVVAAEDARRMYDDFYSFLSSVGIDSVKTDAQFFLDLLLHAPDRRALITEYQDAWTIAQLRHFSSRAISCMSQTPQILFHSQLPTNKPLLLVRNSDDFFPEVAASHPWHVFCNAHNSLMAQHLNVLPDWDMFQTSHEWAGFHAAARCVSGGPIYFTDYPGKHDTTLIRQMTAQTTQNKTVILRPHIVGKSMNPYNAYDGIALLKIGTYVGFARTGTGILGVFNVTERYLSELINLSDFPGTERGKYVIGSFVSGTISSPVTRGAPNALVGIQLETRGWDILTAYAIRTLQLHRKSVDVSLMGLVDKMTGSAAVTGYDIKIEENGNLRIWTSLKALGVLGVYLSDLDTREIGDDFMVMIYGKPIPRECVTRAAVSRQVLEIDVEKAWKDSGEAAGWSNEVSIEIFVH